jgi:hypothetical protein
LDKQLHTDLQSSINENPTNKHVGVCQQKRIYVLPNQTTYLTFAS